MYIVKLKDMISIIRNVNGTDMIRVVTLLYPIRCTRIYICVGIRYAGTRILF